MTCSIDNLTLLSNLTSKRQFQGFMNSVDMDYIKSYRSNPDVYPYRDSWLMTDGSFLQYADDTAAKVSPIRFEFNPNKCAVVQVLKLMTFFQDKRASRVDVAIDFDKDLSQYVWICSGVKSTRYSGRSRELETLYFGGSGSSLQFRIYNKALEQKEQRTWWRVEAQKRLRPRESDYLPEGLFRNLFAIGFQKETSLNDRALLHYLHCYPEEEQNVTRWHKKRLIETASDILNVNDLYLAGREKLKGVLDLWLN